MWSSQRKDRCWASCLSSLGLVWFCLQPLTIPQGQSAALVPGHTHTSALSPCAASKGHESHCEFQWQEGDHQECMAVQGRYDFKVKRVCVGAGEIALIVRTRV